MFRLLLVLLAAAALGGCELIADFDRSKIVVDAGAGDGDGGPEPPDAAEPDAAEPDAAEPDAAEPDEDAGS